MAVPLRLAALLWIALAATSAHALVFVGPPKEFPTLGAFDVEVSGGITFICTGAALQIFDASDPASGYALLGSFPEVCSQVRVRGTLAYLTGNSGLRIVDVSNPASPVGMGVVPLPARRVNDFDIVDGRAYVLFGSSSGVYAPLTLWIADVSNPAAPAHLGGLDVGPPLPPSASKVAVENGVAFVHNDNISEIVDVTNPAAPTLIGPLGFAGYLGSIGLAVHDGILYATADPDVPEEEDSINFPTVRIVDVSNPAAPVELSRFDTTCRTIEVVGGILYCGDMYELRLTDVSDPTHPEHLGVLYGGTPGGILFDVAAEEGLAHIAVGPISFGPPFTVQAVDVRAPAFPSRSAVPIFRAEYTALEVVGSHLYGGGVGGLDVFDLVDEANPVPVGDVALSGWVRDLAVAGHILYAAADTNTAILDISDPVHPQPLGTLASSGRSLARVGNRLYVGTVNGSLDLYDLANPAQPALLGSLAFGPGRVEDVDVAGSVVFAAHNQFGVRVVDVSDPASPHLIGGFSTPNPLTTAIAGSLLYVGGFNGFGVQILDASDPTQLHQVGAFDRTPNVRELEIRDGRLYATNGLLYVLELVSPTAPATLGAVFPSGPTFALSAAGVAYTSSTFSYTPSLLAIDFGPEYAPPLPVELDVRPGDPWNRVLLSRPVSLLVGLLGSASLDAGQIDPYGLAFGPRGTPAQNSVPASLNGDEHEDLLAAFWTLDSGIAFGDTEVCLTGRLVSGRRLQGCDFINTHVGCGPGWQLALVVPLCIPLTRLARRTRRARSPGV